MKVHCIGHCGSIHLPGPNVDIVITGCCSERNETTARMHCTHIHTEKIGHSHCCSNAPLLLRCIAYKMSPFRGEHASNQKRRKKQNHKYFFSLAQRLSCIFIWPAMQKFIKTHLRVIQRSGHGRKCAFCDPWMRLRPLATACSCCCARIFWQNIYGKNYYFYCMRRTVFFFSYMFAFLRRSPATREIMAGKIMYMSLAIIRGEEFSRQAATVCAAWARMRRR